MKNVFCLLLAIMLLNFGMMFIQVGAAVFSWKEEFNYASMAEMQAAGWVCDTNPAGVSLESGAVVLDGTDADTVIRYRNHFPSGIYDWKVESRSMGAGMGPAGAGVALIGETHNYGFAADTYYDFFAFYRDFELIISFGSYVEQPGAWVTLTMTKQGNTISMYYNGQLMKTYIEQDSTPNQIVGIDQISPWKGSQKYDYYLFEEFTAGGASSSAFPLEYALIGGGIAAAAVAGGVVYYFFVAGGGSAASSASGATAGAGSSAGGTDSSGSGDFSVAEATDEQMKKMLEEAQKKAFEEQQDTTVNRAKIYEKTSGKWDEHIRSSTDSKDTVTAGAGDSSLVAEISDEQMKQIQDLKDLKPEIDNLKDKLIQLKEEAPSKLDQNSPTMFEPIHETKYPTPEELRVRPKPEKPKPPTDDSTTEGASSNEATA